MVLQMKRVILLGFSFGLAALLVATGPSTAQVYAAAATNEQQKVIVTYCDQLRAQIDTIQKNETALRVNRGHIYDLEIIPYITTFNDRITAGKVNAPELISVAGRIRASVVDYANQFTVYSDDLTRAKRTDCRTKPTEFYDWIDKARADRATLARHVTNIDELLVAYIEELEKLDDRFAPVINVDQEQRQ